MLNEVKSRFLSGRKLLMVLAFIILEILSICSYAQYQHTPVKLTFGNDKSPAFQIRNVYVYEYTYMPYEFLCYERVNGSAENIYVSKINTSGPLDSGVYLTNNSFKNINPSIGFYKSGYYFGEILNSIVIWETNRNGNKDIYARIFKQNQGWLSEFPIDIASGDQTNPQVALINQNSYAIVYKSVNDVRLKIINTDNQGITKDTNLTLGINEICGNPYVIISTNTPKKIYISYEREFSSVHKAIYCLKADTIAGTLNFMIDTVRYSGINQNAGFARMSLNPNPFMCIYENSTNGKRNVYGTEIKWNGLSSVHHNILTSTTNDLWSYKGSNFITGDNTLHGCYGFLTRTGNSIYARTKMKDSWDSVNVLVSNDTNYNSKIALSSANNIPSSGCYRMWYVFEKNLSPSERGIYGISFTSCGMNVRKLNGVATEYSLSQNYPNPFNPTTKIKFEIANTPLNPLSRGEMISLKVFDITGKEIATLVNEQLAPGTYEVTFDASMLTSGIYFYRLITDGFSETKRMTLIK